MMCEFIYVHLIVEPSEIDDLYLSVNGYKALGEAFAKRCIQILT